MTRNEKEAVNKTTQDKKEELDNKEKLKSKNKDNKTDDVTELSEEDQELFNLLEKHVNKLGLDSIEVQIESLNALHELIKTSTSSMTSVPKPLKFLIRSFEKLEGYYQNWTEESSERKILLADVLSIIGMSYGKVDDRIALKYRLLGTKENIVSWGHEYVRTLALEIGQEFNMIRELNLETDEEEFNKNKPADLDVQLRNLFELAMQITPFFLKHNAEADAVDLLFEIESISEIKDLVDEENYKRVCLYMISCVPLLPPHDDQEFLRETYKIYIRFQEFTSALMLAIRLDDFGLIQEAFDSCKDRIMQKQLAYILARQERIVDCDDEELVSIISNNQLSYHQLKMATQLDLMEAKTPEDIYKSHLETARLSFKSSNIDSAQQNLAASFVNGFINAGFGNDKLIIEAEEDSNWLHKNREEGRMSATASIGMLLLWNMEEAFKLIDKYTYSDDKYIKAGAFLAYGIANNRLRLESDPTFALLSEHLSGDDHLLKISSIVGLGMAYAGTHFNELNELLLPFVSDIEQPMDIASLSALSLGLSFVGSCDGEIASSILQTLMERDEEQLDSVYTRFLGLGLALLYLNKQDNSEATCETLRAIEHPIGSAIYQLVVACSYAGTGNVEKVQNMLHACIEHVESKGYNDLFQAFAVFGVAMISMGEDIGAEMSLRTFNHLMYYGEPVIRKAVPLALGLLCASNPQLNVLDSLSKYSHDNDLDVATNAIFAIGMVGAGTNNARIAQMLRQLASYYSKENNCLFMVRIAQGLLYMGKGTIGIHPFHSDRSILSITAMAGLLTTMVAFTDAKNLILDKSSYFLFYLVTAMYPRFLITIDESGEPVEASVRVGQAVDTVGQAGRPKTITGFQTHTTPVLLAYGERAELATEEYIAMSHVLEGFVILKKNPDYIPEGRDDK